MSGVEIAKKIVSLVTTFIGLAVILIGLRYALEMFGLIFGLLKNPEGLMLPVQQLARSIGGSAFDLRLSDRSVPLANIMALVAYGFGAVLCAWLTLAMMHTGARIVSLALGDKETIRQLLLGFAGGLRAARDRETERRG